MNEETEINGMVCMDCGAKCCRYVATGIDTPTCKRDYDQIRWYLLHADVMVFIDHDGDWYLEFPAECTKLDDKYRCTAYKDRPLICREHGENTLCEHLADGKPYEIRFHNAVEFETYLESGNIDWKWKKHTD